MVNDLYCGGIGVLIIQGIFYCQGDGVLAEIGGGKGIVGQEEIQCVIIIIGRVCIKICFGNSSNVIGI